MMIERIFLLIIWIIPTFVSIIEARDDRFAIDSSYFESFSSRNPFESQLPKVETTQEKQPKLVEIEPPEVSRPVPKPQPLVQPVVVSQPPPVAQPVYQPPPPPRPVMPSLKVTGLVWNTDQPGAIINGQIVGIGDTIQDVKILNIYKDTIEILFDGRTTAIHP